MDNMNLDHLILKTNVAIAQASNQYLKANLKPALEEWKKQQTSMFKEKAEVYDYIMNAPFILRMQKELEALKKENGELREKISILERNQPSSPNSNGSNIVLEITEKQDSDVRFVNLSNTDIFGASQHQNGVISETPDSDNEEDIITDNGDSDSHITSSNDDEESNSGNNPEANGNTDDDEDDDKEVASLPNSQNDSLFEGDDNEDDEDEDDEEVASLPNSQNNHEDDEDDEDDEDEDDEDEDDENEDDENEDDEDEDEEDEDEEDEDEEDDDEYDNDENSPIHQNIQHTTASDGESTNKSTDGEDSSVEVYETSISDALFPEENYYVTNEVDGEIYKIGPNGNVGNKIGKFVNKKPTLI
jgi:hypothetical protein